METFTLQPSIAFNSRFFFMSLGMVRSIQRSQGNCWISRQPGFTPASLAPPHLSKASSVSLTLQWSLLKDEEKVKYKIVPEQTLICAHSFALFYLWFVNITN